MGGAAPATTSSTPPSRGPINMDDNDNDVNTNINDNNNNIITNSNDDDKDPNTRPTCFASTLQECAFVLSVTMAVAMTSFLTGSITVMASFAGRELDMTNAEVTWMAAATRWVDSHIPMCLRFCRYIPQPPSPPLP